MTLTHVTADWITHDFSQNHIEQYIHNVRWHELIISIQTPTPSILCLEKVDALYEDTWIHLIGFSILCTQKWHTQKENLSNR